MNNYMNSMSGSETQSASSAVTGAGSSSSFGSSTLDQFLTNLSGDSASGSQGAALSDSQKQDVQNILTQYQDAPATANTFKQVHEALKQAGIHVHHHHGGGFTESASASASDSSAASSVTASDSFDSSAASLLS